MINEWLFVIEFLASATGLLPGQTRRGFGEGFGQPRPQPVVVVRWSLWVWALFLCVRVCVFYNQDENLSSQEVESTHVLKWRESFIIFILRVSCKLIKNSRGCRFGFGREGPA